MTNIDVDDSIYNEWTKFFEKQKKEQPLEYPTLKIFTAKTLKAVMEKEEKKK